MASIAASKIPAAVDSYVTDGKRLVLVLEYLSKTDEVRVEDALTEGMEYLDGQEVRDRWHYVSMRSTDA